VAAVAVSTGPTCGLWGAVVLLEGECGAATPLSRRRPCERLLHICTEGGPVVVRMPCSPPSYVARFASSFTRAATTTNGGGGGFALQRMSCCTLVAGSHLIRVRLKTHVLCFPLLQAPPPVALAAAVAAAPPRVSLQSTRCASLASRPASICVA